MKEIITGIEYARKAKKMSQSDLATAMGVDIFTVISLEKGIGELSYKNLKQLMYILDATANFILFKEYRSPLNMDKLSTKQQNAVKEVYLLMQTSGK